MGQMPQQPSATGGATGSRLGAAHRTAEPAQRSTVRSPRTLSPDPKRRCTGEAPAVAAAAAAAEQSPRRSWVQLAPPVAAASPPRLPHAGVLRLASHCILPAMLSIIMLRRRLTMQPLSHAFQVRNVHEILCMHRSRCIRAVGARLRQLWGYISSNERAHHARCNSGCVS